MNPNQISHSDLEEIGQNLVHLLGAGARTALALSAAGLAAPRLVVRIVGGSGEPAEACCCGTRHHYHYCYQPPIYRCRG